MWRRDLEQLVFVLLIQWLILAGLLWVLSAQVQAAPPGATYGNSRAGGPGGITYRSNPSHAPGRISSDYRRPGGPGGHGGPPSHHSDHDRRYFFYGGHRYPFFYFGTSGPLIISGSESYGYPGRVYEDDTYSGDGAADADGPPSASYEITDPAARRWIAGHYEEVAREEPVAGETVEVFHPAVYRRMPDGSLNMLEKARVTHAPKTRVVLSKEWIAGHYEGVAAQGPEPGPGGPNAAPKMKAPPAGAGPEAAPGPQAGPPPQESGPPEQQGPPPEQQGPPPGGAAAPNGPALSPNDL